VERERGGELGGVALGVGPGEAGRRLGRRMERVADVLVRLGQLPKNFDVKSMYYPAAASEG